MSTAIGVVMTAHIVAGKLVDNKLACKPVRFPADRNELDALMSVPGSEIVERLAEQVVAVAGEGKTPIDAIGVAVPGVVRHGIVEDAPNHGQI